MSKFLKILGIGVLTTMLFLSLSSCQIINLVTGGTDNTPSNSSVVNTEKFKVKFNTNGGTKFVTKTVLDGEKVKKPKDPTKAGYVFTGWYSDAECLKEFD